MAEPFLTPTQLRNIADGVSPHHPDYMLVQVLCAIALQLHAMQEELHLLVQAVYGGIAIDK